MPAASRSIATSRTCCITSTVRRWLPDRPMNPPPSGGGGARHVGGALHTQIVLDVRHARRQLRQILGAALEAAARDGAVEHDLAILHGNLDVRGIDEGILGQALAHVLMNALVGPLVPLGAPASVQACGGASLVPAGAYIGIVRIAVAEGAVAGAMPAVARVETFVIPRTASPVVDHAAGKFVGIAAIAARIFPPLAAEAHGALWHVTVAVVIVEGVPVPA